MSPWYSKLLWLAIFGLPAFAVLFSRALQKPRPRNPRLFPALLLSTLWTLPTLLIVQHLNLHFQWWSFKASGPRFCDMPVDLYLGWVILWGIVPQLVFPGLGVTEIVILLVAFDLWLMPSLIQTNGDSRWLLGEVFAAAIVLWPSLHLMRATLHNRRLSLRVMMQTLLCGLLFLYLLPEMVFALQPQTQHSPAAPSVWQALLSTPHWLLQVALQVLFLLAVPGLTAVQEFAQRGRGTPIPYDPPLRLVTSGIYRYCANPMQLSCAVVMLVWAALLHSLWFAAGAVLSIVYSAGLATWDEHTDLARRFGVRWQLYRIAVPAWRLRWRPYHAGPPARLYISASCGSCSELRRWLEARQPLHLDFIDAETLPAGSITRLRYNPIDGTPPEDGLRALARALEHCNLAWAYCGFTLRLPVFCQVFQLLMDACGFGPRTIPSTCPAKTVPDSSPGTS